MNYISNAMGWILAQLSELFGHNFAASVFVFTLLVNVIMLPLTIKSQRSTAKQAKLRPKLDALKKKYGNDRQKYSQAMNALYTKEGVSMSGGCLPMIVRLVIMMGVYWAVASPFTYVAQIDNTAVNAAKEWTVYSKVIDDNSITEAQWNELGIEEMMASEAIIANAEKFGEADNVKKYAQYAILNTVATSTEKIEEGSIREVVAEKLKSASTSIREVEITNYVIEGRDKYEPIVASVYTTNNGDVDKLDEINFKLFGIDLTEVPNFQWNLSKWQAIWIIPILSFATSMLTSIIQTKLQKKTNPDAPSMAAMMLLMPLFSLYIAFKVPGAVGFYWACSNVVSGGLQIATQIWYGPNVMIAKEQGNTVAMIAKKEQARIDRVNSESDE